MITLSDTPGDYQLPFHINPCIDWKMFRTYDDYVSWEARYQRYIKWVEIREQLNSMLECRRWLDEVERWL